MKNYKQLLRELPSKSVVVSLGSFNPPSVGHELQIKVVRKLASQCKADHIVFVSPQQDSKKNPLEVGKKISYLELFFPNTRFTPAKEDTKTFLDVVKSLNGKYKNVLFVVCSDKVNDYKKVLQQHNNKQYRFENIDVVSAGSNDPDSDDRLRSLASKGNYLSFKSHLPTTVRDLDGKRLMNDIRIGLGLEPIKEQINLVKDQLREQYFRGQIFNEGDIVESENRVFQIVKRGSNHLLLQDETGSKMSKWIQDVQPSEREFMLNEDLQTSGTGKTGGESATAKTAENQRKMLELKAKQAKQIEDVKERQERETQMARDSMKEGYTIPKTLMSLHDFRKTLKMGQKPIAVDNDKETESDIDAEVGAVSAPRSEVGGQHMSSVNPHDETVRRMKVKYHLGESKLNPNDPHGDYKEKSKTLHQLSLDKNVDQAAVTQRKLDLEKEYSKLKEETLDQQGTRKAQLKRFKDQAAQAQLGTGCVKEDTYKGLEKEDKPGKKSTEFKGTRNSVTGKTVEGWKDEKKPVAEEYEDINEEEFIALVEADLDNLDEDAYYEAYDDEELAIIDEETGEELEAVAEEAELDNPMIVEVLSRIERIKAKARMRRSKAKRERRHAVAIRQLSTPQVANKRARRLAISAMKKRLLRGQNPAKVSVGQKERVERFIAQRKKIVDRLSARMVSRVKQIEKARLQHKKFTKPNNGVSF